MSEHSPNEPIMQSQNVIDALELTRKINEVTGAIHALRDSYMNDLRRGLERAATDYDHSSLREELVGYREFLRSQMRRMG